MIDNRSSLLLETPRLIIRPFRDSDLEPFVAYRNDPEVYRYQGWKTPFSREEGLEFIERAIMAVPGMPGEWLQLALERKDNGEMLGDLAFHLTRSDPRQAYLGYSLARPSWGQGFASEAVRKLLDYLFRVRSLHRIMADCDVDNTASIRLLERVGFRREAHYLESFWLERENRWGGEYLYAMLSHEWTLQE
jgi:RimJ/RimL family protein N-acetyltransferase